ncbi:unnamed protein product [Ceratitis capitata]|uniref:(Mediterranean fruit fly) hypothetical protein n=1 Tax=Ceratitis capitata TaxID=7213 RepID=A0A811UFG7_CERCA|nr:unnamed protein product [Ceratitis capitata]
MAHSLLHQASTVNCQTSSGKKQAAATQLQRVAATLSGNNNLRAYQISVPVPIKHQPPASPISRQQAGSSQATTNVISNVSATAMAVACKAFSCKCANARAQLTGLVSVDVRRHFGQQLSSRALKHRA